VTALDAAGERAPRRAAPVLPDVVREHLEETVVLFIQRRKVFFSPEAPLSALRRLDARIEAHAEGLAVNLPESLELALEAMDADDPWDVFGGARAWLLLGEPRAETVLERLAKAREEVLSGWTEAFRRAVPSRLAGLFLQGPPAAAGPAAQAVLTDALAWHGLVSPSFLAAQAASPAEEVRCAAARALGWCAGGGDAAATAAVLLEDPSSRVRRAALWSLALLEPHRARERCRAAVRRGGADPFVVRVLGLLGDEEDAALLSGAFLEAPELRAAALRALGDLGYPVCVDRLVAAVESPDEGVRRAARAGLETLFGTLPTLAPALPPGSLPPEEEPLDMEALRAWQQGRARLTDPSGRRLRGHPFPWEGEAAGCPMESLWRASLLSRDPGSAWLRREVPDGFFSGSFPAAESVPGE